MPPTGMPLTGGTSAAACGRALRLAALLQAVGAKQRLLDGVARRVARARAERDVVGVLRVVEAGLPARAARFDGGAPPGGAVVVGGFDAGRAHVGRRLATELVD